MSLPDIGRLGTELQLLEAMYPDQIEYNHRSRDFKFSAHPALLHLRLPEFYPETSVPDVIAANDASKRDIRNQMKATLSNLALSEGEEALDAVIAAFQNLTASTTNSPDDSHADTDGSSTEPVPTLESNKTVIIWLHHLLAMTKRKLAIAPASSVSGITKPGYPGIMVFSGPASAVTEHVNTLKAQNWQAFQVRYEDAVLWEFAHATEVREVGTMAEVVKAIETGQRGAKRKEEFLKAAGIK